MCQRVIVLGASGHAKVIADIIIKSGNILEGFLDDKIEKGNIVLEYEKQKYKVIGRIDDSLELSQRNSKIRFVIAIGDNYIREEIANKYKLPYITLVHPKAIVAIGVTIDIGTVIMANAVVNTGATIGKHCIINTGAVVEHDNVIENYVHISPNATLAGTVAVGAYTHIGVGASVKNNIKITENCVVGAGAVVVNNINDSGIYIGIPARNLKR